MRAEAPRTLRSEPTASRAPHARKEWTLLAAAIMGLAAALPVSIAAMNVMAGAATGLLVLEAARRGAPPWASLRRPLLGALLLYCAWGAASGLLGVDRGASLRELPKDLHKVWVAGIFLAAFGYDPCPELAWPLAVGFTAAGLVGLWQVASAPWQTPGYWTRAHAFVHPVTFGGQMAVAVAGATAFLRPGAQRDAPPRLWVLAFGALAAAALVLSQTRGALVGAACGVAAMMGVSPPLRRWLKPALGACAAALAARELIPSNGRTLLALWRHGRAWLAQGADSAQLTRLHLWDVAWRMFRDHPLTGVGPGNYRTLFDRYYPAALEDRTGWGSAHNVLLHQLAERGIVGATILLAILWLLASETYRRARARPEPRCLWAWGATVAFLVVNLSEVAFQTEQFATLLLLLWAWSAASAVTA